MNVSASVLLPDEAATRDLGSLLAKHVPPGSLVFLDGELGAGKTTLVREAIHALGWTKPVRSPSYALIHSYALERCTVHHLDLYRLGSVDEAVGLDLDTLLGTGGTSWIEWPDRLGGTLTPDWTIRLEILDDARIAHLEGPIEPMEAILAATPTWRTP